MSMAMELSAASDGAGDPRINRTFAARSKRTASIHTHAVIDRLLDSPLGVQTVEIALGKLAGDSMRLIAERLEISQSTARRGLRAFRDWAVREGLGRGGPPW